jgi:energy-coupling factor transporter transmembrane protein EcfT
MEEQPQTPFQAAIKPGLTIGLISLAVTYLVYFINSTLLVSAWFGLISLVIFFVLIIFLGTQYRTELGGFMNFGTAFNFSFITLLISGLIGIVGQILLYQVIDPSLPEVLADQSMKSAMEMMERFGANPEMMSTEQMDEIRNRTLEGFSIGGIVKNFGIVLIIYAIIALILAAILKKRDKSLDY